MSKSMSRYHLFTCCTHKYPIVCVILTLIKSIRMVRESFELCKNLPTVEGPVQIMRPFTGIQKENAGIHSDIRPASLVSTSTPNKDLLFLGYPRIGAP